VTKQAPTFPPLLKGHRVPHGKSPIKQARAMLKKGDAGAGDLFWSESELELNFALVLEPEVSRSRCGEIIFTSMVAFGDAAGAICPPEIAVTYRWPSTILINGAKVGHVDLVVSDEIRNEVPDWMILSVKTAIRPDGIDVNPGNFRDHTTLWDEGCGGITRTQLLESVSRHIVNWIHAWNEDGFKSVHDKWTGRLCDKVPLDEVLNQDNLWVGLDETGDALVKNNEATISLETLAALGKLRDFGEPA